jgi:sulfate transport system substrate-binding protein
MLRRIIGATVVLYVCGSAIWIVLGGFQSDFLNVSYDPTRELWLDINEVFATRYEQQTGVKIAIRQSHGGSASQARSVIEGQEADVVTLAMWSDTDLLRKRGLIDERWEEKFPNHSLPYYSTIVFVVRKGNPKKIKDWPDLVRPGVSIIVPDPKRSGNGKLAFAAAWGAVRAKDGPWGGGTDADAEEFVTQLFRRVPVLDSAARAATMTFAQREIGDVHLTWENEAHMEVDESHGALELVYPSVSIRAEPHVAVVDANVSRRKTAEIAKAYIEFLYTDEAQEIIARHNYRPMNQEILDKHSDHLPATIRLFPIKEIAKDWDDAQRRFFSEGGVFDKIFAGTMK